jgi:hypothetical protein
MTMKNMTLLGAVAVAVAVWAISKNAGASQSQYIPRPSQEPSALPALGYYWSWNGYEWVQAAQGDLN